MRLLSKDEVRNTVTSLVGMDPSDFLLGWPIDYRTDLVPFDTNYVGQTSSLGLVEAVKLMAEGVADRLLGPTAGARLQALAPCAPGGAGDKACMRQFIEGFGKRALRRPLEADEAAGLESLAWSHGSDFSTGVSVVVRTLLQDPEFIYLLECGGCAAGAAADVKSYPDDAVFKLTSWEMASRLSYLLWGTMPDDYLLARAAADKLVAPEDVRAQAKRMLAYPAAHARVQRFHGMWWGYEWIKTSLALPREMLAETNALLSRVIFEKKGSWLDLLQSTETYANAALATHYGDGMQKPPAGASRWVPYSESPLRRMGLLSHGSILSVDNGPNGPSATFRGKDIRRRLLCQRIPLPAEVGMSVDTTPPKPATPGECTFDIHARTYLAPGSACVGCHAQMDPIGFGLDNYDADGRYRTAEPGKPGCPISGQGQLQVGDQQKPFKGPSGLSQLLLEDDRTRDAIAGCIVTHFFRFAAGRQEKSSDDKTFVDDLTAGFKTGNLDFQELMLSFVSAPGFGYRLVDPTQN